MTFKAVLNGSIMLTASVMPLRSILAAMQQKAIVRAASLWGGISCQFAIAHTWASERKPACPKLGLTSGAVNGKEGSDLCLPISNGAWQAQPYRSLRRS